MQARPPNPGPDDGDRRAKALRSPDWGHIAAWAALVVVLLLLGVCSLAGVVLDQVQL